MRIYRDKRNRRYIPWWQYAVVSVTFLVFLYGAVDLIEIALNALGRQNIWWHWVTFGLLILSIIALIALLCDREGKGKE